MADTFVILKNMQKVMPGEFSGKAAANEAAREMSEDAPRASFTTAKMIKRFYNDPVPPSYTPVEEVLE